METEVTKFMRSLRDLSVTSVPKIGFGRGGATVMKYF